MKRNIILWQLIGFATVSILGVILHFLFDLTHLTYTALFSAVNESTWEHMKLIFFPMFLFAVVQYIFMGKEYNAFWCIKLRGTLLGLILIPALFYTTRGVFGPTPDWVNIAIFFLSAGLALLYETKHFIKGDSICKSPQSSLIAFCVIAAAFAIFTFNPPQIPLFQDPTNGGFGIMN